ncbi:hypothetical protein GQR58_002920 [Nymphon striatum]|nr:hypothetical protein GQR58_002920 [Nymphon striatum]
MFMGMLDIELDMLNDRIEEEEVGEDFEYIRQAYESEFRVGSNEGMRRIAEYGVPILDLLERAVLHGVNVITDDRSFNKTEVKQNGITVRKGPISDVYLISFDAVHIGKAVGEIQTNLLNVIYSAIGGESMSLFFKEYRDTESTISTGDTPEDILTRFQQSIIAPTTTLWMYSPHHKRKRVDDVSDSESVVSLGQSPSSTKRSRTDRQVAPSIEGSGELLYCQETDVAKDSSKIELSAPTMQGDDADITHPFTLCSEATTHENSAKIEDLPELGLSSLTNLMGDTNSTQPFTFCEDACSYWDPSKIDELVDIGYLLPEMNQDVGPQSDIEEFMDFAIRLVKYAPSAIRYQELMARNLFIDETFIKRIIDAAVLEVYFDNCSLDISSYWVHVSNMNVPFYERNLDRDCGANWFRVNMGHDPETLNYAKSLGSPTVNNPPPVSNFTTVNIIVRIMAERTERANAKRNLTRKLNEVRRMIAENDVSFLDQMENVKTLFKKFMCAHESCCEASGDDDIEINDLYFEEMEEKYIKTLNLATNYSDISSKISEPKLGPKENVIIEHVYMPKVELQTFYGNPLHYHEFIISFELNVETTCSNSDFKLARLLQYTSGVAKEAIRGCQLIGGDTGYQQARSILQERFGNKYLVTERVMQDLKCSKPVRTPFEIQSLADKLRNASLILNKLNTEPEINSQSSLIQILSRMPQFVQIKWKTLALENKRSKGVYPNFEDFVKFVADIAEEMNDPVYGQLDARRYSPKDNIRATTNVTATSKSPTHYFC